MSNYLDGILSGQSGYSKTTAAFAQPAVGSNVTVFVGNAGWAIAGVAVNIAIGGSYQVVSVPSLTQLTLKNLGGASNAAPAATVPTAQVIAPGGTPGLPGAPGAPVDIATVITSNVANLAAGPTTNDGVVIANGDLVGLAGQTDTTQVGVYTFATGGIYTLLATQPPIKTLLRTTKGLAFANQLYSLQTSAISLQQANAGSLIGANTVTVYGVDAAGLLLVANEGIPRISVPADAAFHTAWSLDFVGRGLLTGSLTVLALLKAVSGTKSVRVRLEVEIFCSATPTISAASLLDILDDTGGSGGYVTAQFSIVSTTRLELQLKNLQGGAISYVGIVGLCVGTP